MRQEVDQHVAAQVVEDLAVVVDVSRRLVVGHHDDLFGLVLVGSMRADWASACWRLVP